MREPCLVFTHEGKQIAECPLSVMHWLKVGQIRDIVLECAAAAASELTVVGRVCSVED